MKHREDDFSAIGRVKMHIEAIEALQEELKKVTESGDRMQILVLKDNLLVLERSLVGEANRLAQLVRAA